MKRVAVELLQLEGSERRGAVILFGSIRSATAIVTVRVVAAAGADGRRRRREIPRRFEKGIRL